jgi:hypothetical protein
VLSKERLASLLSRRTMKTLPVRENTRRQATYVLTKHSGVFIKRLLQLNNSEYCIFWRCIGSLTYPVCKAHAPSILSSVDCHAVPYFSILAPKQQGFPGKKSLTIKRVFLFSLQLFF